MDCFHYPLDTETLLRKKRRLRRELLAQNPHPLHKKIAILGGSTTNEVADQLGLFLLQYGIEAEFYQSEYAQYWQDAMFGTPELDEFHPDIIYIHTSWRNLTALPTTADSEADIDAMLDEQYAHFETMWQALEQKFACPVIQNNFDRPNYRLMGNRDIWDPHGRSNFISRLNQRFYAYAAAHEHFYINDIDYLSADYGLTAWGDAFFWHMYKYAMCLDAIPSLANSVANIIKSLYGRNKKALVLDLDNTLWGGIVGDDGPENLEIGQETNLGQVYAEFQSYVKSLKEYGVMLNVASKNEEENALAGLNHPAGVLKPEDFLIIAANWEPKSRNILEIAHQLNILPDSLVFADDNPAEREIVRQQAPGVTAPEIGKPEDYIRVLDRGGYFEVTSLSEDDRKRNEMYQANLKREKAQASFADYTEYLRSLDMKATIRSFEPVYMARIAQLTNKSNQFNLTTQRMTQAQIEQMAADDSYITLYGKLEDKFGDNGVVSVVIAQKEEKAAHIRLWLMSCRVLKRDMELAMLDELVKRCQEAGIEEIYGYYYPTAKNNMVRKFYGELGFEKCSEDEAGNSVWKLNTAGYEKRNHVIEVES